MPSVKYKNGSGWFAINNSALKATETTYGVAKVATDAQIQAGVDDESYVTSKKIGQVFYEKNKHILHFDWIGTLEEYEAQMASGYIQSSWICFITDDLVYENTEWGNIGGNINNQVDLINFINSRVPEIPSQVGNTGKFLTTNGSTMSWQESTKPEMIYWD